MRLQKHIFNVIANNCGNPVRVYMPHTIAGRLTRIISDNAPARPSWGMDGALDIMAYNFSREHFKNAAASSLLAHRRAIVVALRRGKPYTSTYWLDRAAHFRALAMRTSHS